MVKRIMPFLGAPNLPTIVYEDNKSTITMANAGKGGETGDSKHVDVCFVFI
jgi:hypothetical protein